MALLSQNYIQLHRNTSHTYAAFGKMVMDILLDKAETGVGSAEVEHLEIPITFHLSAFDGNDCIRICLQNTAGETWCSNQFSDAVYQEE